MLNTNADTSLRTERFISLPSFGPVYFGPRRMIRRYYVPAKETLKFEACCGGAKAILK
jgi:hypothetical protein